MKKLLCVVISVFLLLGVLLCPHASAVENHCALFDEAINRLRWHAPYWDVTPGISFPVASIMQYTRSHFFTDEYGDVQITVGDYSFFATYVVPAEEFEAAAQDFFAVVDVEALRNYTSFFWDYENDTGIDGFRHYQPDREVYLFSAPGGMGDASWYEVLGYTVEDGLYTVYSRFVSLLWDPPQGVEGEDYIQIGEEYFAIEHYLKNIMAISNGRAQFYSWEEIQEIPDLDMTGPLQTVLETETVKLQAEAGVFPADTVFSITTPEEDVLKQIEKALGKEISQFVAYEIQASAQPDGTVQVTFTIPEGFDPENVALFYLSEEGELQQVEAQVDTQEGVIVAQLPHLSIYVLAQMQEAAPLWGDANDDGIVNVRDGRLILQLVADLITEEELSMELADINQDGKVTLRDARAILKQIAGIND